MKSHKTPFNSTRDRGIPRGLQRWVATKSSNLTAVVFNFSSTSKSMYFTYTGICVLLRSRASARLFWRRYFFSGDCSFREYSWRRWNFGYPYHVTTYTRCRLPLGPDMQGSFWVLLMSCQSGLHISGRSCNWYNGSTEGGKGGTCLRCDRGSEVR